MNPFKCNASLRSYDYPLIKIVVCIAVIALDLAVSFHLHSNTFILNLIIRLVSACILLACVFCVYISFGEMNYASENRRKAKPVSEAEMASGKWFSLDEIAALARDWPSIEFEILSAQTPNQRLAVGSKSDLKPGTSHFFNKCYYIGEKDYTDPPVFLAALKTVQTDAQGFFVLHVDGGKPT